ncbi:DUF4411 family protein [Clavibacter michiganensis]|uniref:DUF4411 family protein n=1 Tax=Clavibacter michiganensis TaxID=28447 RepID=UPI00186883CD|nr:DUF4411 family protein [Clavibacter michiganensis]MBE3079260.1 DUF4411 family protein [Clavibacter michiganensis subsp. michiganensis]
MYSVDTSALIDGIERFYPRRNFPLLWDRIDLLIEEGRMHVSEEAWTEATAVDAPVRDWCEEAAAARDRSVYPTTAAVATIAGQIGAQFPNWVTQGRKNGADPFVIAVAEVEGGMVISGETHGGPGKPKIPYVCSQRQVDHGRLVDLITSEDWVIG